MGTIKRFVPVKESDRQKSGPDPLSTVNDASKCKTMRAVVKQLCSMATRPGGLADVDTCRECESQCAYGRRFIDLWDDELLKGEDPMKQLARKKPGPKPKEATTNAHAEKPPRKASGKEPETDAGGESSMTIPGKTVEADSDKVRRLEKELQAEQAKTLTLTQSLKGAMDANQELAAEVKGLEPYVKRCAEQEQEANKLRTELASQQQLTEDMQVGMTALVEENKKFLKRAQDAEKRIQEENTEFALLQLEVIKLKAKLWDAYHSEE